MIVGNVKSSNTSQRKCSKAAFFIQTPPNPIKVVEYVIDMAKATDYKIQNSSANVGFEKKLWAAADKLEKEIKENLSKLSFEIWRFVVNF